LVIKKKFVTTRGNMNVKCSS